MNKVIFYLACAMALLSCGSRSADDYESLNSEVEDLKLRCDSFQNSINNKNLTVQDIADREYEIDNIKNILHADERSISSLIGILRSSELLIRQLPDDAENDDNIRLIYHQINKINAELKRCHSEIASEGTQRPAE